MSNVLPVSPTQQVINSALAVQAAGLSPALKAFLAQAYGDGGVTILPLPYHSMVRFAATRDAGPPVSFTIAQGSRTAFAYAQGQDMAIAGRAGTIATPAETNLLAPSQTRDNADVWIEGMSCFLTPDSEPALAARVWKETDISIALNGTQTIPLGRLEMYPGAGGLYGTGRSFIKSPDLATPGAVDEGSGSQFGFVNNGNPMASNYFRFRQPFKWSAIGSAGTDSSLGITFRINRAITETAAAARAGGSGVSAYTPPAAAGNLGTFVDVLVMLHCVSVARRSQNV